MTDSQWLRFEVFKQDRPGQPHRNVGSVHAPDAEMAWQNARDVFARRPACHSLWVVPAAAIATLPATADSLLPPVPTPQSPAPYLLFAKQTQRQSMTYVDYVGEIVAESPEAALAAAATAYPDVEALVWWACPAAAVWVDPDGEAADLLEPSQAKLFRMPNQYHTVFTMQKIKRGEEGET
jgi:ring-1,2-phenylacetyl-CoA epoxidase subunit PaaB